MGVGVGLWLYVMPQLCPYHPSCSAALQSVFPPSELGSFMALTKQEKQHQLVELVHIVTGIRLFNKECGKGGAGIDDCESPLGGYASLARGGYASLPRGGYVSLPRGGYVSLPRGGYVSLPRGGYVSLPRGGYASLPRGGYASLPRGGYASLPRGGYVSLPWGGYVRVHGYHIQ